MRLDGLPKETEVVVVCTSGIEKSPHLAQSLAYKGRKASALEGGIKTLLSIVSFPAHAFIVLIAGRGDQRFEQAQEKLSKDGVPYETITEIDYRCQMNGSGMSDGSEYYGD